MSTIVKVVANEEGRYPVTLFGEVYEIEPVKSKTTERTNKKEREEPPKLTRQDGTPAQPTTEDNAPLESK